MDTRLIWIVKGVAIAGVGVGVGCAVALGAALLGHEYLAMKVGEANIYQVDDTPLMFALVGASYLAGIIAGLVVLVLGWRRFVSRA